MKRVARTTKKMKKLDLSKPLDISILGSEDDPCFGKHHSLTASECSLCGDREICAVLSAQQSNVKLRKAEEAKHKFKDLEEAELMEAMQEDIHKVLKKFEGKAIFIKVAKRLAKKWNYELVTVKPMLKKFLSFNTDTYKYNKDTKIITTI